MVPGRTKEIQHPPIYLSAALLCPMHTPDTPTHPQSSPCSTLRGPWAGRADSSLLCPSLPISQSCKALQLCCHKLGQIRCQNMSNPTIPAVAKVTSAGGRGGEMQLWAVTACPRLIPSPVGINSLGSLELESSEANQFGKADKAGHFAIIKLVAFLFKRPKCRMMLSFDSVAQNKITCPPSAAPPSVQPPGVTWCFNSQGVPVSGV